MSRTRRYQETLVDYINSSIRAQTLGFNVYGKLNLGGGSGSGGGSGTPPGGIIGQLIQKKVTYDTTESGTMCLPVSGVSLLDNLNRIRYHQLPATWFETSPTNPPSMRVRIASGLWYKSATEYVDYTGGVSPIITLPTSLPRIDILYLTTAGNILVQEGVEASGPTFTVPSGTIMPIGTVYVTPLSSTIDYQCTLSSGYIHKDLRPFLGITGSGGGNGAGAGGVGNARFVIDGRLVATTDIGGAYVATATLTIGAVYIYCGDAGTGGTTTVDVHKNGTTIFTVQGNRPALAWNDGDKVAKSGTPDVTTLSELDVLTVDTDVVATAASKLTVIVALE